MTWLITVVYGPTILNDKAEFWFGLASQDRHFSGPWACLGDFNAILSQSEKQGGHPFASPFSSSFQWFLLHASMVDIGCIDNPFSWANKRYGHSFIQERLDRVVANGDWHLAFP